MCQFFSVTSNGSGQIKYFDWELRKKCLSGELDYNPDSHTSINDYFGFKGIREDKRNKYEYNPITGKFIVDKINGKNDRKSVEKKVRAIDFKTIIPQLNIHPIINPFEINPTISIDIAIQRLKQWDSVGASVRASVWDSVGASVWDSVGDSVGDSVWDSVWDSVRASVRDSVGGSVWDSVGASVRASVWDSVLASVWDSVLDSVRASVRDSVGDSVRDYVRASFWDSVWDFVLDSVGAYISSYFTIGDWKYAENKKGVNPFQCMIDLWNAGYVPSYDGNKWRLHTKEGIVWEGKIKE